MAIFFNVVGSSATPMAMVSKQYNTTQQQFTQYSIINYN